MQTELTVQDGRVDFDFLMGSWKVSHRRLRERLKGSDSWEEFEGTSVMRPLLGGLGNIEEGKFFRETGEAQGVALRLFDVETQLWRIYWADGSHGVLDIPMIGEFENGRGEFLAQELFEGKPIFSRFLWTVQDETTCRWEQAFSADSGKTWETNWTMDFTKIA